MYSLTIPLGTLGANAGEGTYRFHTVSQKPMKAFDEQQKVKHDDEGYVKVITKYGKRQEGFGDEHPCLVIETLIVTPVELEFGA